jgi:C1A family cysteine protease
MLKFETARHYRARLVQVACLTVILLTLLTLPDVVRTQQISRQESFGGKLERPSAGKLKRIRSEAKAALKGFKSTLPPSQFRSALDQDLHALASADDPAFSWRTAGDVTPVRDQNPCGSCYVFGPVGAMESNWAIRHNKQMIDSSEQHALNCSPGDCKSGGYLSDVMTFLVGQGTSNEIDDPYRAKKRRCRAVPIRYKALARDYVAADGGLPTSRQIKQALLDHGPVAVFIYAGGFGNYWNSDRVIDTDSTTGNHVVLIIGWDDDKTHSGGHGAWEIKNSWGPDWGRDGFGYVAYGVRDIGDNAMWIEFTTGSSNPRTIHRSKKARLRL